MPLIAESRAKAAGLKAIPGHPGLPVVGRTFDYLLGKGAYDTEYYERFGPVNWHRAFGLTMINVSGVEATNTVLRNADRAYANEPGWSFFLGPFFRRGLVVLDFDEHMQNKRIMQRAFTRERLIGYLGNMTPTIRETVQSWRPGRRFEVYPQVKNLTLDIAARTFIGERLGRESEQIKRAFVHCVEATTTPLRMPIPFSPWARGLSSRKFLEEYLRPRVALARKADRDDLLAALCHVQSEEGEKFTDDDVIDHMIFLLMAAHDTSTIAATAMIYRLAANPEWQRRCREEALALGRDDLEYADLDRLPVLDLVFKESLRLTTPIPGILRKTVKDTELMGHLVPKDSFINIMLNTTHHMADLWDNPNTFDPERFERGEGKNSWMPFGGGVHKCIGLYFGGMEVKALLHQMLLNYEWSVPAGYRLDMDWSSLPKPRDGLRINLTRR
ncbi:cytochrome P450 [Nocardia huaxiensis]|uniref:cytochrome P450 n=1 Tax=Nocardia huaxiensis TaxID=2755382 RepID=UPI001E44CD14|nr:cytochrome P450 [Nocardia huaxiensis]UFS98517.1 cytochrome P450 [Nocardia huaxiensis]